MRWPRARARRRGRRRPRPSRRRGHLPDGARPRRPVRGPLLGDEAARPAGPGAGRRARHPPARRADQPPRYRRRSAGSRTSCCDTAGRWSSSPTTACSSTRLATRIVELDRGRLYDWACDYPTFLKRREELLAAEARQQELFDKKLAQEEAWIRKGIEARRTRNEGRVRALKAMREAHRKRRERQGTARMQVQEAERSGNLVIEAKGVGFGYGEATDPVDPRPDDDDHARRQGRDHRPQRLGQDDAAPALARRAHAARRDDPPGHATWRSPTSTS